MKRFLKYIFFCFITGVILFNVEKAEAAQILYQGTYDETIKWTIDSNGKLTVSGNGEGIGEDESWPWLNYNSKIISAELKVTGLVNASYMFENCYNLKTVECSNWDTSTIEDMSGLFRGCSKLTNINVKNWDTGNVKYMFALFQHCTQLKSLSLENWNTGKVESVAAMFEGCENLSTTINFSSNLLYVDKCFTDAAVNSDSKIKVVCKGRTSVTAYRALCETKDPGANVVINGEECCMISPCSGKVENIQWSINKNGRLTLSGTGNCSEKPWLEYAQNISSASIEVTGMTEASGLFENCWNLIEVDTSKWDTSKITDMSSLFSGCYALRYLDVSNLDMSQVKNMDYMFYQCVSLTYLQSYKWNLTNIESMYASFYGCEKLLCNLTIKSNAISDYTGCFYGAALYSNSGIFIDYAGSCTKEQAKLIANEKNSKDVRVFYARNYSIRTLQYKQDQSGFCYLNGKPDITYTGLAQHGNQWWMVEKGVVTFKYNNLVNHNGSWYYVKNSIVDFGYTGLCKYNGSWYYIKSGKVDFNYTGLCKYSGSWYYVKSGKVDFNYTGLCKYSGSWYYVKSGKVNFNYTGLCKYSGSWYYVKSGKVSFSYTGLCKYSGSWYYVKNGVLNWNYTGLCKCGSKWYYVQKGVVNFKYTGYTTYAGTRWYVKKGIMVKKA